MAISRGSKYEIGKQAKPPEETGFTPDTLTDRRRRILDKMTRTVDELRTYIERYGQAVDAERFSTILLEQIDLLDSLQPTDDWKGYLRDIRRIYDESAKLARKMSQWKKMLRPEKRVMSDQTRKLRDEFNAREESVMVLVEQHKQAHDSTKDHMPRLRQLPSGEKHKVLDELQSFVRSMCTSAGEIRDQLYDGINNLVTEELKAQLGELRQPGEGG
ncbi:MAG: hypothetical protein ACE5OS_13840 [Anaerolineae bacterium]